MPAQPVIDAVSDIAERILVVRGQRVLLDADLAEMYGVKGYALDSSYRYG